MHAWLTHTGKQLKDFFSHCITFGCTGSLMYIVLFLQLADALASLQVRMVSGELDLWRIIASDGMEPKQGNEYYIISYNSEIYHLIHRSQEVLFWMNNDTLVCTENC